MILGGASCVWTDAANALLLGKFDLIIAINDIGTRWSDAIDTWCTLHPDKMAGWRADRKRVGYPNAGHHVGHIPAEGIDEGREYRFSGQPSSGSSGLFAVKIAMDEGCDRIVLAGVPMAAEQGHHDSGKAWDECPAYLPAWQWALPILRNKVKSLSGWTAKTLGRPDAEWLNG